MHLKLEIFFFLASVLLGNQSAPVFKKHVFEMSHNFNNRTIYWPSGQVDNFTLQLLEKSMPDNGVKYVEGFYMAGEHGGTHMDSPYHFNVENGQTIEQLPLERMQAPAVVVDVRQQVEVDNDYQATMADYMKWEEKYGKMPDNAVFLLCTGWEKNWPDQKKIFGTDNIYDHANMHFPGMHPDLVRWLIDNRKMAGVGIDTPTPDGAKTIMSLEVHIMTSKENMYILENVKGVCDIPHNGVTLLIFPMKIEGGTGAPTRIVGTWGDDVHICSGAERHGTALVLALTCILYYLNLFK